jgi:hypothetical protein
LIARRFLFQGYLDKIIEIEIEIGIAIEIEPGCHTNRFDPDFDPEKNIADH